MNLEELRNKSILMLGKPRAFNKEEFLKETEFYEIDIIYEYNEDVVMVVDGKMMTPYEQNKSDELYEKYSKEIEFISIDTLEEELVKHINPNTLLMSLKLSKDKERLKSFIQNSCLRDELFFKLLKMYSWNDENFFDNNDNRDVSAAIILRFYKDIERNHNVQYATSGYVHLISQTDNATLLETIAMLEPLQNSFKKDSTTTNYNILKAIATHPLTPKSVIKMFIKKSDSHMKTLLSIREDNDDDILLSLYETNDDEVHKALSYNLSLSKDIINKFLQSDKYVDNIARFQKLDYELFENLIKKYSLELAENESLTSKMQARLVGLKKEDVLVSLASNIKIESKIIKELLSKDLADIKSALYSNTATSADDLEEAYDDEANHASLAYNNSTPSHILEKLSHTKDIEVLQGLAKNENTPVEVLYQLQLDARLARSVKENPAFGQHIQTENLGWL